MPAGNWSFSVRALDAAGNLEAPPFKNYAWSISLDPGYPIISVNITAISRYAHALHVLGLSTAS